MNFNIDKDTTATLDSLAQGLRFEDVVKLCTKSGMDQHESVSTTTYLNRYQGSGTPIFQSLNAETMELAYTGNVWAWVHFEQFRGDIAYHYTKDGTTPYNGGYWERYTVATQNVHGEDVDDLIMFPVFYTESCYLNAEGNVHVINSMNFTDVTISQNAFAVFVTIMAMTLVAEKWYQKEEQTGRLFYMMRDTVIQAMRDGLLWGLTDEDVEGIEKLID